MVFCCSLSGRWGGASFFCSDGRFLFVLALNLADAGADARMVFNGGNEFGNRIAEALGDLGQFDPANQFGIGDGFPARVGFHGSKRKLGLANNPALWTGVRENLADGDGEFL